MTGPRFLLLLPVALCLAAAAAGLSCSPWAREPTLRELLGAPFPEQGVTYTTDFVATLAQQDRQ